MCYIYKLKVAVSVRQIFKRIIPVTGNDLDKDGPERAKKSPAQANRAGAWAGVEASAGEGEGVRVGAGVRLHQTTLVWLTSHQLSSSNNCPPSKLCARPRVAKNSAVTRISVYNNKTNATYFSAKFKSLHGTLIIYRLALFVDSLSTDPIRIPR